MQLMGGKEMEKLTIDKLNWNYDFKKILLGENYDANKPIQNILKAKDKMNYVDEKNDYHKFYQGHIENYQIVEDIFQELLKNESTDYKDVMNSFWTTYKCFLQIEYPEVFMPEGNLNNEIPLEKSKEDKTPSMSYPPHTATEYSAVPQKYIDYYNSYFPQLTVDFGDTWVEFLQNNFVEFDKVHEYSELKKFATLTHTIGNITVVPKGFNGGRNAYDYWDWGMLYLNEFLSPFNSWKEFVNLYFLDEYVNEIFEVIEFWNGHLKSDIETKILPKSRTEIEQFLIFVNSCIKHRGIAILEKIK